MIFSAKIAALTNQVRDLEGQLNAANGNVSALEGEKAELQRQLDEANAKLQGLDGAISAADHQAALAGKDGELATVREELATAKKDTETKIAKGTVERIAKTGFAAVQRDPKAIDTPTKTEGNRAGTPLQRLSAGIKVGSNKG